MKVIFRAALIIAIATLIGCDNKKSNTSDGHDGHAHNESLQLAAYCDDFEVFAEASPFVVGQESDILAHFTHLADFKPLTEGRVTATLTVGAVIVSETLEQPTQAGIYLFTLEPTTVGKGNITFDVKTPKGASQLVIPDITVYTNEHDAHQTAANEAVTSASGVVFTKEQSWKVDFATVELRVEPFGQVIRTTAQIQPSQLNEWTITAKAGGTVFFSSGDIVDGKAINAGQSLFYIEGGGMVDNNLSVRYAAAESEYLRSKAEYERKSELAKDRIVSQSDLMKVKVEFNNAEAVYSNLKGNFTAGRQIVKSPKGGFISRMLVRNGEYVEAGQPVLVVSQNQDLIIKAELQSRHFDVLSSITSANVRLLSSNRTHTLEELNGRVVSYGRSPDISTPLIPVVFQVNNKAGMLPGGFVEMFIKTKTNTRALTVPNEAIIEEMGNYFVFAQLTPEYFEKRAIRKGATDGIRTEILAGVTEGERVVSKGAILVKLAQSSGALDPHSGHVH